MTRTQCSIVNWPPRVQLSNTRANYLSRLIVFYTDCGTVGVSDIMTFSQCSIVKWPPLTHISSCVLVSAPTNFKQASSPSLRWRAHSKGFGHLFATVLLAIINMVSIDRSIGQQCDNQPWWFKKVSLCIACFNDSGCCETARRVRRSFWTVMTPLSWSFVVACCCVADLTFACRLHLTHLFFTISHNDAGLLMQFLHQAEFLDLRCSQTIFGPLSMSFGTFSSISQELPGLWSPFFHHWVWLQTLHSASFAIFYIQCFRNSENNNLLL